AGGPGGGGGAEECIPEVHGEEGILCFGVGEVQHRALLDGGGSGWSDQGAAGAEAPAAAADDQLRAAERAHRVEGESVLRERSTARVGAEGGSEEAGGC